MCTLPKRQTQIDSLDMKEYDIAIIGGGPAGIMAAIAASRTSRVILLEKNPSLGLSMASWSGNVFAQVTQKLPWKVMLTLGGGGAIGHSVASVYGYSGSYHWTYAGLHRSFFKGERLTVRLWMQDPFEGKYRSWYSRTVQGEYTGYSKGWNRSRQFGIAFTWRFGKHNVSVKKANTTIENSDVVGGIKKDNAASQQ